MKVLITDFENKIEIIIFKAIRPFQGQMLKYALGQRLPALVEMSVPYPLRRIR